MTTCNDPCVVCSKQCDQDPQHTLGLGKLAQTHEHSYEYVSHNSRRKFRVTVIHQWRADA